jgi:thiol-disulfide isomerase/thioredoxin
MRTTFSSKVLPAAASMVFLMSQAYAGNSAYDKAVADYTAGKYGQAASEFESLKAAYPSNLLVRYYLALTRQALGHFDRARAEYQWVATNGDARLKAMAQQGLSRMGNVKSSFSGASPRASTPMAGDYIPPFANTSGSSAQSGSGSVTQPNTHNGARVTRILKFTAPWCGVCQTFAPVFESVKPQFRDVSFEDVDFDSSPDLRAKYNVANTPHLVFLDSNGKVLFSKAGAPRSAESLTRLIQSYH